MERSRSYSRQTAYGVFLLLLGISILNGPEVYSGRDAWIANLLASLAGLYILYAIITIQNYFPGVSIVRIGELTLGRTLGTILNILFKIHRN